MYVKQGPIPSPTGKKRKTHMDSIIFFEAFLLKIHLGDL